MSYFYTCSSLLSVSNIFTFTATGTAPMIPAHFSFIGCLCTGRHKSQPWWIHAALIHIKTAWSYMGNPAGYLGGANDLLNYLAKPSGRSHVGERSVFSCDYFYLQPVAPKMNHTCQSLCLFILICSICGTAVVCSGCCWQKLVCALPWQQYSWQAQKQAAHSWLINANNEAANQE